MTSSTTCFLRYQTTESRRTCIHILTSLVLYIIINYLISFIQLIIFGFTFVATVRKNDAVSTSTLMDFGLYVAECLPKYVQKVQIVTGNELEVLIAPDGIVPVLQFLKDHHQCQFASLADIGALDVPSRENRFEV